MKGITSGKLWHWKFEGNGEQRYLLYTGRDALYVHCTLLGSAHFRKKARCDDLTMVLGDLAEGDDAKVKAFFQKYKLKPICIPYTDLERVDLLPLFEPQLRIRYRVQGKPRTLKLTFGGGMTAGVCHEELRAAISPSAPIESEQMSTRTAITGPIAAALVLALLGCAAYFATELKYEGLDISRKILVFVSHTLGRGPIVILTIIAVALALGFLAHRVRKPLTVSLWRFQG